MLTKDQILTWLADAPSDDYMLGYGSLMSHCSRSTHSGIDCPSILVTVLGFERGWVTRSEHERQTYVGAWQQAGAHLNAQLVPVDFNPVFQQREQDYEFVPVSAEDLVFAADPTGDALVEVLAEKQVWICRTLDHTESTPAFPVNASYVATCLAGCLESGDEEQAHRFIAHTRHWPEQLNNDLHDPNYPRHASLPKETLETIEALLNDYELLNR